MLSMSISSIVFISWLVLNPSKKWTNGTLLWRVDKCATSAISIASWTPDAHSIAQPVCLTLITSEWSPNIDNAWVASALALTCITQGVSSPAILYIFGIISSRPWLAVKVVVKAPEHRLPCKAPDAPPSDCISTTLTLCPKIFVLPSVDHWSQSSAIVELGVIGYIVATSLSA